MGSKGMRYGAQFFPPNFLRAISNGRFKEGTRWKGRMKCCIHLYPLVSSNMTGILLFFHSEGWWFPINDSQASVTFCTHGLLVFSGPRLVMKHILGSEIPDLFLWNCHFLNGFWFPFTPPRCFRSPQDVFFFHKQNLCNFLIKETNSWPRLTAEFFRCSTRFFFEKALFRKAQALEGRKPGEIRSMGIYRKNMMWIHGIFLVFTMMKTWMIWFDIYIFILI